MENKKEVLIFSAADENNFSYAVMFWNSLVKFHSPKEVDMIFFTTVKDKEKLKLIPQNIKIEDITPYLEDPLFWYRQKPLLAEQFMDNYELVLGMDCDQIVLGDLSYIFNTKDYDVGTVINWNRYDQIYYPLVDNQRAGITPIDYFNCGLVALRSKKFVHQWKVNCFSTQFDRMQYKEQDVLNMICYFGNFNVRCFDHGDGPAKMSAWWGLISKGEYLRAELKDGKVIVPKGLGNTPFPLKDMELKVIHAGGGSIPQKMAYQKWFSNEKIIEYINYLVSPNTKPITKKENTILTA